jgi:hypothetical protein
MLYCLFGTPITITSPLTLLLCPVYSHQGNCCKSKQVGTAFEDNERKKKGEVKMFLCPRLTRR